MRVALVCDFDGTITDIDTGELILSKFAKGDWRQYDELYDQGGMPMEETMRHQFALVKGETKASMIRLIDESVHLRPGFEELLDYSERAGFPVAVVSYGLDFCIERVLSKIRNGGRVRVYAPKARVTRDGIGFSFPGLRLNESTNLKDDVVGRYRRRGFRVVFVGDGTSDFPAIKLADSRFALEGSTLARLCDRESIACTQITDFAPVAEALIRY